MSLVRSSYNIDAVHTVGIPMLVNSPATSYAVTSAASVGVFGPCTGSDLIASPFNLSPSYPLRMQLHFSSVVMTGTVAYPNPEYIVKVTGPFEEYTVHRYDEKNFGTTHFVTDWQSKTMDTTVSIHPISPLTGVSLSCFAGIAVENVQDRSEEY
jgi:hypothetical protein